MIGGKECGQLNGGSGKDGQRKGKGGVVDSDVGFDSDSGLPSAVD